MKSFEVCQVHIDSRLLFYVLAEDGFVVEETRSRERAEKIRDRCRKKYCH